MKFGELESGTWFSVGDRVFVKLITETAGGIPIVFDSYEWLGTGDSRYVKVMQRTNALHFNVVDVDGVPGSVPEWLQVEIVPAESLATILRGKNEHLRVE